MKKKKGEMIKMFLNDQPTYTGILLANFAVLVVSSLVAGLAELLWPGLLPESFKRPVSILINVCIPEK